MASNTLAAHNDNDNSKDTSRRQELGALEPEILIQKVIELEEALRSTQKFQTATKIQQMESAHDYLLPVQLAGQLFGLIRDVRDDVGYWLHMDLNTNKVQHIETDKQRNRRKLRPTLEQRKERGELIF